MQKKLTIGMATYNDFNGVYFTIESIRMFHREVIDQIEFMVIDTNHDSPEGHAVNDYLKTVQKK